MAAEQTSVSEHKESIAQGIHVVAKPIGPVCNLNCEYCFYLEKQALFAAGEKYRMSDKVLSAFITNYITSQPTPVVEFVWQGGEPTLLGIDFFKRVVDLQKPFVKRKTITNSLQTNGTLLTAEWCQFLKKHNFMVGISLDGPKEIHDRYRRDRKGNGTFDQVMRGLKLLQEHKVEYNVLACVARDTAKRPLDVYRFFKDEGVEFIQFTPVVERLSDVHSAPSGLRLAGPAALDKKDQQGDVTPWSVIPEEYGDFLIAIYEEWVRHDVGTVFVMNFEWVLNAWIGNPSPVCVHAKQCGRSVVIEHNGDVYRLRPLRVSSVQAGQYPVRHAAGAWSRNHCGRDLAWPRKQHCLAGARNARCWRPVRADAPNIDSKQPTTMNRGFSISARDTRNSFSTFASTCGPWPRCWKTASLHHA